MKKLLAILGVITIASAPPMLLVSCDIGSMDGAQYLSHLPDFNWNSADYGDGINYAAVDSHNTLTTTGSIKDLGVVQPNAVNSYLNYSQFNTGFQWDQNIKKQAVTGAPLNKGFMPNGNYLSDFGVTSAARRYERTNSILDWNPGTDMDAKYNVADKALVSREFVATKLPNQDARIKYNQLGFSSRKHRTYDNTIVGTKNPFEATNLNWQYVNSYINWSGSWFEGPIVPPPADVVDQAHMNGVPIYGDLFLDGFHGLTKEMLKDFVQQNPDGSYKIVDILIKIANYLGFDGWFINNESNGALPNGAVLNYTVMAEIIREFNRKVATSDNPDIQHLKIIFYKNGGSVYKNGSEYIDPELIAMSNTGYTQDGKVLNAPNLQLDFDEKPDRSQEFLKEHPQYQANNLFSIVDFSGNHKYFGSFDDRQLAYAMVNQAPTPEYDKKIYGSFSYYLDNGSSFFGDSAYKWAHNHGIDNTRAYLLATQVSNLYNDIQFNGTNSFISTQDVGLQRNDFGYIGTKINFEDAVFALDPRIKAKDKGPIDPEVQSKIFNYAANKGINTSSYGIGDLVPEQTTIFDDKQHLNFTTNFSTGSGVQFINRNVTGQAITAANYPWTNRRIADVLPTYQWRITKSTSPDQAVDIAQMSGWYDYDDVYQKGNSIAIGGGVGSQGEVLPAHWDVNQNYNWKLFGTNLVSNAHQINLVYKDHGAQNNHNANVDFLVTVTNQNTGESQDVVLSPSQTTKLVDGWTAINLDLNQLKNVGPDNRISQIGVQLQAKTADFKFNIGELSITDNAQKQQQNSNLQISNPQSEYVINRLIAGQNLASARFAWTVTNNVPADTYYAFYYYADDKWYRVGETSQSYYYLRDLPVFDHCIKLMIKPVINGLESDQGFSFRLKV